MRTKRKQNKHGLFFKIQGNFLLVTRKNSQQQVAYLKWINPDYITPQMIEEDFTVDFYLEGEFFPRVNKHGVEFDVYGANFNYEGQRFSIGLPMLSDISHVYTPELLISILWGHGSFCHQSQCWKVYRGDKNEKSKDLIWNED